jgi:3-(3-hydroxy-phenyl)propionate hydroxylase
LQRLDVAIVDEASGGGSEWLSSLGVAALVVRPDRYIFGTARSGVELDALVSQVETALTRSAVAAPGA